MWGWTDGESGVRGTGNRPGMKRGDDRDDAHLSVISVQFAAVDVGAAF